MYFLNLFTVRVFYPYQRWSLHHRRMNFLSLSRSIKLKSRKSTPSKTVCAWMERERDRERERGLYVCVCVNTAIEKKRVHKGLRIRLLEPKWAIVCPKISIQHIWTIFDRKKYIYLCKKCNWKRWKGKFPRYPHWHIMIFHAKNKITGTKKRILTEIYNRDCYTPVKQ